MKIHIGCGAVYLQDYINIDAEPHFLTEQAPFEILLSNTTSFDNYYKTGFCMGSGKVVADVKGISSNIPFPDNSVDEIVMLHVLEHIPNYNVGNTLNEFRRVLKKDGTVILGVPDIKETSKLLSEAITPEEEDWAIRLIYGTQRNQWSHHFCGYTERTLKNLLSSFGFGCFENLSNINFYPAIHIKAVKLEQND